MGGRWTASTRTALALGAALLAVAFGLTAADALIEGGDDLTLGGLAFDMIERVILVVAMLGVTLTVRRLDRVEREAGDLRAALARAEAKGQAWRDRSRRLLDGLSRAVAHQFDEWRLTPAEAEIAALMLKGLSLGDIGRLRRTSEATIRQQAQGVYRKSGLTNRAELSAYFLEDLFTIAEGDAAVRAARPRQ